MTSSRPAAAEIQPGAFPASPVAAGHVEPVPRRVRAFVDHRAVVDTLAARYVWEHPWHPQFYVPAVDVDRSAVVRTGHATDTVRGGAEVIELVTEAGSADAGACVATSENPLLADTYRFHWDAFDAWFEEDEEVFGHPRSPFVRVDALRSRRAVPLHVGDVTLARSTSPVAVFETGLPPRWYLDRNDIRWEHLREIDRCTLCPSEGRRTGYWSVEVDCTAISAAAWSYESPTRQLLPIAGLVAFDDAQVTVEVD